MIIYWRNHTQGNKPAQAELFTSPKFQTSARLVVVSTAATKQRRFIQNVNRMGLR